MGLCVNSHLLLEEASLMMAELGTDLWVWKNVIRCHFIARLLPQNNSIWFSSRRIVYPVQDSRPPEQYQAWVPSQDVGLKSIREWLIFVPDIMQAGPCCRLQGLELD